MQNKDTIPVTAQASTQRPARERVGLVVYGTDSVAAASTIVAAEAAGVRQVWMTQGTPAPDTLTIYAASAMRTTSVRMGTAIVPTYPRHPLVLAQQALALGDLAPNRLRLGVGTSPILISALRERAFHLAGELTDGAISWVCPVRYLLEKALPALQAGAAKSGRPAPPLLAHIPVALSQNRQAVLAAARRQLGSYGRLPFYAKMFADAGFPVAPDGTMPDALIDNLVVSGDEAAIAARLIELLAAGLDELLVMPVPVADPEGEQTRLMRLIGQL